MVGEAGLGEKARRAAGGASAAGAGVGEREPVLGARAGDVEQPPFLGELFGVGVGERAPGRQQLLLAGQQEDLLRLGSLGAMDRGNGDAPVLLTGLELLRVKPGAVLQEARQRRRVAVLVLVGLRRAAQRAQVLEHALGVAALVGLRGALAALLEMPDQPAVDRQGGDDHVPERAPGAQLAAHALELRPEALEPLTCLVRADLREPVGVGAGGDQVAVVFVARERDHAAGGREADPAPRRLHRAAKRLRVGRVGQQRQVGHRVADLRALVQAEVAEHAVRDPRGRQRGLGRLGGVAGAREHEDLARRDAFRERVGDRPGDPLGLLAIGREGDHIHLAAGAAHRQQRLAGAVLVVRDAGDRRGEDLGPAAEVAAEHDPRVARVALAEAEHVPWLRAAPAVDQLIVIGHDGHVAAGAREQRDEHALRLVGVLEFVHQQPAPALAVVREPVGMLGQQPHRVHEQIVEVERVRAPQLDLELTPHGRDERAAWASSLVGVGGEQSVLGQRDLPQQLRGCRLAAVGQRRLDRAALGVREQPLDHLADVGLVVDRVGVGAAEQLGVFAQHPRADRVKRRGRHAARPFFAEQVSEPQPQLAGRAHAERDREDLPRLRSPAREQMGDPVRDGAGLAGPRAGEQQQRTRTMPDRVALLGRQLAGQLVRRARAGARQMCHLQSLSVGRVQRDHAPPAGDRPRPRVALAGVRAAEQQGDQRHRLLTRLRRAHVRAARVAGECIADRFLDHHHDQLRAHRGGSPKTSVTRARARLNASPRSSRPHGPPSSTLARS